MTSISGLQDAPRIAGNNLRDVSFDTSRSVARLSSGIRIVDARDDATSLSIGSRVSGEVRALSQASINIGQGTSVLQTADGAAVEITGLLQRAQSIAVQAGAATLSDGDRALLDVEFQAILEEIGRISSDTAVVDQNLIDRENVISAPPVPLTTFTDPGLIDISIRGFDTRPVAEGGDGDITFQLTFFGQPNAPQFVFDLQAFTAGGGFVRLFGQIPTELVDNSGSAVLADLSTGVTVVGDISNSGGTVSQFTLDNAQFVISVDEDFDVTPATNVGFFSSLEGAGPTQDLTFRGGTGILPDEDDLDLRLRGLTPETLGLSLVDVTTASRADAALGAVAQAIDYTSSVRADLGSGLFRFEFATDLLRTTTDGQEAARSSLLDLDTAREVTRFVSLQIVQEAGISVFAQADNLSRELLALYSQ